MCYFKNFLGLSGNGCLLTFLVGKGGWSIQLFGLMPLKGTCFQLEPDLLPGSLCFLKVFLHTLWLTMSLVLYSM